MNFKPGVALRDVSFSYEAGQQSLFSHLSVHFPVGFTGIVGANGAGKSTLLQLITGQLTPLGGVIEGVPGAVFCEQRTDSPPQEFTGFLEDLSGEAFEIRGRLGIDPDFFQRWNTLSHGERKRAQIGHALWKQPALLAIDEPTNHIDSQARDLLLTSLRRYRGIGLIVSHDRELLDELCSQCVWLEPPDAQVFPGGFTQAREQKMLSEESAKSLRDKALAESKQLKREIVVRRAHAAREHSVRSKRGLSRKDSDAREKIDRARVADSKAGQGLRALDGRMKQATARLEDISVRKEYDTGIWLPGSRSRRRQLFRIEAGAVQLGNNRSLRFPTLHMNPDDRVAITGANGTGKSTLIAHILDNLNVPGENTVDVPQEVSAELANKILNEARLLPRDQLGQVMTVISRLGSRPDRLLESHSPSPGELRKLLLALGMMREPQLIVMDEPTNHLDLPSIEALEAALIDCPCGLLVVSHDRPFLARLGVTKWHIEAAEGNDSELVFL